MNEEINDLSDPNYQDYTTATDWEVFIARIEEIIRDFKIPSTHRLPANKHVFKPLQWKITTENLQFNDVNFILSYYSLNVNKEDCFNINENEFVPILNDIWTNGLTFVNEIDNECVEAPVGLWYGLREYLVLVPSVEIFSESRIKLYLSSISIALANIMCPVPIFLKIRSDWQHYYVGLLEYNGMRSRFDTVHLGKVPHQCYHLSGILDTFKAKLASPTPIEVLEISTKFSFKLDCNLAKWKCQYVLENLLEDQIEISSDSVCLPCGSVDDPLLSLTLNVIWPKLSEDAVMDTPNYSDFDSLTAPVWSVEAKFKSEIRCILPNFINSFALLLNEYQVLLDVLPGELRCERHTLSSKLQRNTSTDFEFLTPIPEDTIQSIMYFLFPDAVDYSPHNYDATHINNKNDQDNMGGFNPMAKEYLKIGPEEGLIWRLALVAVWIYTTSGVIAFAQLWYEFIEELQFRWDHHKFILGVVDGQPSARTCLLHQKMQLLNFCIKRAEERAGHSSDEEEFFDCDEDENVVSTKSQEIPEGRACLLGDVIGASGAPIYVPLTQEPSPRTDDDVKADAALLMGLGDSTEAAPLRARIMSASLTSDMQAFKAANPGATFADFVRWYSPRDWNDGVLSERMLLPDNAWSQAWNTARAIPAARQRRLFDERREAERTLHFLRTQTVSQATALLLPSALRCVMKQLGCKDLQVLRSYMDSENDGRIVWDAVIKELCEKETIKAKEDRLKEVMAVLESNYQKEEDIDPRDLRVGWDVREKIWNAASSLQPITRQFCVRAQASRRGRVTPQMFRALLKPSEMRLLTVFTNDMVFSS